MGAGWCVTLGFTGGGIWRHNHRFMIKPNLASIAAVMALALFVLGTEAGAQSPYYTDTGSPANPDWATILPTLNVGSGDPGPVYGSAIDVNNTPRKMLGDIVSHLG